VTDVYGTETTTSSKTAFRPVAMSATLPDSGAPLVTRLAVEISMPSRWAVMFEPIAMIRTLFQVPQPVRMDLLVDVVQKLTN
jgi:hypothetical protein